MNRMIFFFISLFVFGTNEIVFSQNNFRESKRNDFIDNMVANFEDIICNHYQEERENSHLAIIKYIKDLGDSMDIFDIIPKSEDGKKLTPKQLAKFLRESLKDSNFTNNLVTENSLNLLNKSFTELKGYVWITREQRNLRLGLTPFSALDPEIISEMNEPTLEYYKEMERTKHEFVLNYYEDFSEKLMIDSYNKDIKDFILTFREVPSDYPQAVASALSYFSEEELQNQAVKTFIAFELYYSYLNLQLQNE